MLVSLILALQSPLDRYDAANQRHTECIFAVSRETPLDMPSPQLVALLRRSCTAERADLRSLAIANLTQRGMPRSQAEREWLQLEETGIQSVVRARAVARAIQR